MEDEWLKVEACNHARAVDMMNYLIKLSNGRYCDIDAETRETLLRTHRHFEECRGCKIGYRRFKAGLATNEIHVGRFSPNDFKILTENENYLESLFRDKK